MITALDTKQSDLMQDSGILRRGTRHTLNLDNCPTYVSRITRTMSINGVDVVNWLFQCEHYFEIDDTPEEAKLKITTI